MARGIRTNTQTINGALFYKENFNGDTAAFDRLLALALRDAGYSFPGNGPRNDAKAAHKMTGTPYIPCNDWKKILTGEDTTESAPKGPSATTAPAVVQKVGQKVPTFQDLLSRYTSNAGNLANLRSRLSELEKTVEADKANLIAARDIAVAVNVEASKAEETHKATCDKNAKARAALIAAGLEDSAALIVDPPSPSITRVSIPDLPF